MNYDTCVDMARTMTSARRWQEADAYWQMAATFAGPDEVRRAYCLRAAADCLRQAIRREIAVPTPRPALLSRLANIFRHTKRAGA